MTRRALLALALACLALTGCTTASTANTPESSSAAVSQVPLDEVTPLTDPKSFHGGSTALLSTTAIEPIATNPAQTLPVTVTSHDLAGDTEVTVNSTDRVLGLDLSGSIAATIVGLGLGDTLVGRDVSSTFDQVKDLPVVTTGGHSISSEAVIALRPTLVITDGTIGPIDVVLQLRDAGIAVVFVDTKETIEGAADVARQVGETMGVPGTGELLAQQIVAQTSTVTEQIADLAPTTDKLRMLFLYLRGSSGIYYLFGEGSGADVLIDSLGGVDVAKEINWSGMKPMTDEAMIAADPDLILVMTDGLESVGGIDGLLAAKPAIGLTTAGKNKRFVDMADGEILAFGPRLPAVLDALARAVYAPATE